MRQLLIAVVLLQGALSQAQQPHADQQQMATWASQYCRAPWAKDSPERTRMHQMLLRISPTIQRQYAGERIVFIAVQNSTINAWTIAPAGKRVSLICVPTAMIDFMSSDGELAFIMGHETGHAVDEDCKQAKTQNNNLALIRACESRADAVGFDLLVKSGFKAYDAGAAFGKIEMYLGDSRQSNSRTLASDHPMTPDRIQHMHNMLIQYNSVLKGPLSQ